MKNIDRALAYAKQRGVEAPDRQELSKLKKDELMLRVVKLWDDCSRPTVALTKMTKPQVVDEIVIATLMPQLTPAQRRRIRQSNDAARSLRDRRGRKLMERVRRQSLFAR